MQRITFLTGAPTSESLDWDEAGLLNNFEPEIADFFCSEKRGEEKAKSATTEQAPVPVAGTRPRLGIHATTLPSSLGPHPAWRSVPFDVDHPIFLDTEHRSRSPDIHPRTSGDPGFSIDDPTAFPPTTNSDGHAGYHGDASGLSPDIHASRDTNFFFSIADPTAFPSMADSDGQNGGNGSHADAESQVISEFCDQSLVLDEVFTENTNHSKSFVSLMDSGFSSSFVSVNSVADDEDSLAGGEASSAEQSRTRKTATTAASKTKKDLALPTRLNTIAGIPSEIQLQRQRTWPTVSFVGGVMSVSLPRSVPTRFGNMAFLVEVLLGDETRSGFAVSFWSNSLVAAEALHQRLHRRDVVLMQDVVLGEFKGRVFGRSVRAGGVGVGMLGNNRSTYAQGTRMQVLYRPGTSVGFYGTREVSSKAKTESVVLDRARRVVEWVRRFVSELNGSSMAGADEAGERPPADSQ